MNNYNNEKDEKLLISHIEDTEKRCLNRNVLTCTDFLSPGEQSTVHKIKDRFTSDFVLWGGFDDAERKILFFLPDYPVNVNEEIKILQVSHAKKAEISHRQYLGSVLNCGIKREKTGDILVFEDMAQIIVKADIADFLDTNYFKAGRCEISTQVKNVENIILPEQKTKEITDTVPSLRLDCIISSAYSLSREKAKEAINAKLVFVNDVLTTKPDITLSEGDKFKISKKGRAVLKEVGKMSKKGRTFIKIERYV